MTFSWAGLGIGIGLLAIAVLIAVGIPPEMDVFNHFHALACWEYPNSVLHTFREPCDGSLNIKLFGSIEWARAYPYVGATYSLLYYPIFKLWPHWNSVVLLDALLMIPGIWAAMRLLKVSMAVAVLALLSTYPIMYYIVRDFGQLTLQLSLLYVLPLLVYRACAATKRSTWLSLSLLAGFLFAVGMESKPVLVYYVPSIMIVSIAACRPLAVRMELVKLLAARLWPGALLAAVLIAIIFTGTTASGLTYYQDMMRFIPTKESDSHFIIAGVRHAIYMFNIYLLHFPYTVESIYNLARISHPKAPFDWPEFLLTFIFWVVLAFAFLWYLGQRYKDKTRLPEGSSMVGPLLLAFGVGVLIVGFERNTFHPHHILQPFYYLLGVLAILLQNLRNNYRPGFISLTIMLLGSQIACSAYTSSRPLIAHHNEERMQAQEFIDHHRLASRAVISHIDWGFYYMSALYGPKEQLVIYNASLDDTIRLARQLNRHVVIVQRTHQFPYRDPKALEKLPGIRRVFPETPRPHHWEIWTDAP